MVSWKDHWDSTVKEGITLQKIGGRMIETYQNMPVNLYAALLRTKEKFAERIALVNYDGEQFSYNRFTEMVDALGVVLKNVYHIEKGDHVGLLLYNGIEFCVAYLALCKIGAVVCSLPGKYKEPELCSLADKADLQFLICEEFFASWFERRPEVVRIVSRRHEECGYGFAYLMQNLSTQDRTQTENDLNDPVILMFTSGTTSHSKGVLLRNYNVMHSVEAYIRVLDLTEEDIALVATPMYHITGLVCILAVMISCGGRLHIHKKVDPDEMIRTCLKDGITYLHASPTVFSMMLSKSREYPELTSITDLACGSGNIPPKNIQRLKNWIPNAKFHTVFGMTETSGAGTIFPNGAADSEYIGASGVPMPNMQIRIMDDNNTELPVGEVGEVCVKASFVLEQYYKEQLDAISEDGWLKTGDLGYCNEAGYLYIVDRKKDMINRGGEKICSFDIENELLLLPGVIEAALIGKPDPKYMEVPVAMLHVEDSFTMTVDEIKEFLMKRVARYKVPEEIWFVPEIPKTINGKVDKRALRVILEQKTGL